MNNGVQEVAGQREQPVPRPREGAVDQELWPGEKLIPEGDRLGGLGGPQAGGTVANDTPVGCRGCSGLKWRLL